MVRLSLLSAVASVALLFGRGNSDFWYAQMDRSTRELRGYAPDVGDENYPVYVEVFPAEGGEGIQAAISGKGPSGKLRHSGWLASQPRVVFLHSGVYNVNKTIYLNTDTILMGDATGPPVLRASSEFKEGFVLSSDHLSVDGITKNCFTVALKNIVIDTTAASNPTTEFMTGAIYWGVSKGSHIQNVKIKMREANDDNGHVGLVVGIGSDLAVAGLRIEYGHKGIVCNHGQQALIKDVHFYGNTIGIRINSAYAVNIINPTFENVGTCVSQTTGGPWISIIDAKSINSGVTLDTKLTPSFLIENLHKDTDDDIVHGPYGFVLPWQEHVSRFTYANTVGENPVYTHILDNHTRPEYLAPEGRYPTFVAPTYASYLVSDFVNVKDQAKNGGYTVKGDGSTDDAAALNAVLEYVANQSLKAYFPFGNYRVESTLVVPIGSRIVGEAWATIVGAGTFFSDASNPKPVVQVGNPDDEGHIEIQDMRFTVADVSPGAIILQVHAAGAYPGDVAIWNSLVTVGGTRGASNILDTCADPKAPCQAAFMGIHLAPTSSVYMENVWNWVADHITEEIEGGSNIAAGRGMLVESTKGTWLHAIGSEHWWLYQLKLLRPEGVYISMLQSETNYDQGDNATVLAPAPWTPDAKWSDPDFHWCGETEGRCRMGMANLINGGKDIYTYSSASWVFFAGPGQQKCDFRDYFTCQKYMHWIEETPENFNAFGMMSVRTYATLRLANGTELLSKDWFGGWIPAGGNIGRYTA
ncbi:glycoside hydrolase [Podospora aff. communis PSN243]|uniref:Glycoside hydrolase n=1 Tax=Podospora aff. communis PSN243 TaxID=3040156 RepID=A0AAV9GT78_9PEZI|nr:glycoside hydrolase [Podospora aff. communis PSN243]